eukprot:14969075-Alexandrium_andersonii.AAC.1
MPQSGKHEGMLVEGTVEDFQETPRGKPAISVRWSCGCCQQTVKTWALETLAGEGGQGWGRR